MSFFILSHSVRVNLIIKVKESKFSILTNKVGYFIFSLFIAFSSKVTVYGKVFLMHYYFKCNSSKNIKSPLGLFILDVISD